LGEAGVGKTAIVEGLAQKIAEGKGTSKQAAEQSAARLALDKKHW